jgi:hypothetical protein
MKIPSFGLGSTALASANLWCGQRVGGVRRQRSPHRALLAPRAFGQSEYLGDLEPLGDSATAVTPNDIPNSVRIRAASTSS